MTALHLHVLDSHFELRTESDHAARTIAHLLGPFLVPSGSRDDHLLDVRYPHDMSRAVGEINRIVLDEVTTFSVHAGVVARNGRAICIPGESGSGKSTLTAALVMEGFDYVSDEAVSVDTAGMIRPYPKPIALGQPSLRLLGLPQDHSPERLFTASELGSRPLMDATVPSVIVLTEYQRSEPGMDRLPQSAALDALLTHSFNHYRLGRRGFDVAADLAGRVEVWRVRYDTPREGAALIRQLLD